MLFSSARHDQVAGLFEGSGVVPNGVVIEPVGQALVLVAILVVLSKLAQVRSRFLEVLGRVAGAGVDGGLECLIIELRLELLLDLLRLAVWLLDGGAVGTTGSHPALTPMPCEAAPLQTAEATDAALILELGEVAVGVVRHRRSGCAARR